MTASSRLVDSSAANEVGGSGKATVGQRNVKASEPRVIARAMMRDDGVPLSQTSFA
jgi:hypothetical protein